VVYGPGQAFPPLPAVPAGSGFTGVNPAWLAGSADRERAVGVLRAAFTEGRLTQDELDDRVGRAYAARTYGDLWALVADLPAGPLPYPGGLPYQQATPAVPPSAEPDTSWHSAAALVITALVTPPGRVVTAIRRTPSPPVPQGSYQPTDPAPSRACSWLRSSRPRGAAGAPARPCPFGPRSSAGSCPPCRWTGGHERLLRHVHAADRLHPLALLRSRSLRLRVMSPP
jgi:hypothetical protein